MINLDSLILAVRKLAEEYPDAIYPLAGCYYSTGECGPGLGCIIGQAAKISCPELYALMLEKDERKSQIGIQSLLWKNKNLIEDFAVNTYDWLGRVQVRQDCRTPWAKCVADADEYELTAAL